MILCIIKMKIRNQLLCSIMLLVVVLLVTNSYLLNVYSDHAASWNYLNLSPTIYVITATYPRAEQKAELTRLAQTLRLVSNLQWVVVEDIRIPSMELVNFLQESQVQFVYLTARMPSKYSLSKYKPRGVANRNVGLQWVRDNAEEGVVYFADDDNTYDVRLFEEIRYTTLVSMFPVGLIGKYGVSSPVVKDGRVVDFYDGWISGRKFAVDMAGFAVNVRLLQKKPKAAMPFKAGYEEDNFLQALNISMKDIEPKANGCTQILVWHTQSFKNEAGIASTNLKYENSNIKELDGQLWKGGRRKKTVKRKRKYIEIRNKQK